MTNFLCYSFEVQQNRIASGGVVEWFKALVLKTKTPYSICKRSKIILKKWPPMGGLTITIYGSSITN